MNSLSNYVLLKLGRNYSRLVRLLSACMAALWIFYIFFLPSYFNLNLFVLENREMIEAKIVNSFFIFNQFVDQIIICGLFSFIFFLIIENRVRYLILIATVIGSILFFIYNTALYLDIITLLSFPLMFILLVLEKIYKTKIVSDRKLSLSLFVNYFLIFLIFVCIYSIFISGLKIDLWGH